MKKRYFKTDKGKFNYIPFNTITPADYLKILNLGKCKINEDGVILLPLSFDIETTSYYSEKYNTELACMYVWQFGVDKNTIIGRTWEEFVLFLDKIAELTSEYGSIFVWVHNFSFEFQYIKQLLTWNRNKNGYPDIFAKSDRNIITARYKNIEFRDSLSLTGMGLNKLQKNYNLDVGKLAGDLDYSLYRHSGTKLTNVEIAYCINDVMVLNDWQRKYIFPYYLDLNKKPPLTSTGIVRQDIKEEFSKLPKEDRKTIQTRIRNAQPSEQMYYIFRNYLFRGGLTHANTLLCNEMADISSYDNSSILPGSFLFASLDLKSAHPAAMLQEEFPWKFYRRNKYLFPEILKHARTGKYSFFGIFTFKKIRTKTWHSLESKNKIIEMSPDAVFDNGRLTYASEIKVALTEIDWFNYEDIYSWESVTCKCVFESIKEPLPDYVRKTICKYFMLKETAPDEFSRNLQKRKVNGIFGMSATSLPEREVVYDPETNKMLLSSQTRTYDELTRWLLMLPQWAIWTAAYTRRKIVQSIIECGRGGIDSIYYDTDSNKVLNFPEYKKWFEEFNASQIEKSLNMETYDFEKSFFLHLGSFELEYVGGKYKVLGAKRYIVEKRKLIPAENGNFEFMGEKYNISDNVETQVTVAGMVKGSLEAYCQKENKDIWEEFRDDLALGPEDSWKQTAIYCDENFEDSIIDYLGNAAPVKEHSCVAIVSIPFTMSLEEEFIERIKETKEERARMIYKGVL